MKLVEFASAEEQLALWKLVSDNVWAAINQQAKAEAEQKALKKAQAKKAPKNKGRAMPPPPNVPPQPKMPTLKPNSPQSFRRPIAKSTNPAALQPTQSVGLAKSIQPKAPTDTQQPTNSLQALGNKENANKARKAGVLAK